MAMAVAGVATLASCLDYDTPEDTLQTNEVKLPDNVYHGNVDSIDYKKEYTADELRGVNNRLSVEVGSFKGAQQVLMGGKINGGKVEKPGPHAYQSYATIAQVYAQYSVIPHSKFQFGKRHFRGSKEPADAADEPSQCRLDTRIEGLGLAFLQHRRCAQHRPLWPDALSGL